jgi:hypothetical protein
VACNKGPFGTVAPVSKQAPAKIAWSSPNLDAIWQRRSGGFETGATERALKKAGLRICARQRPFIDIYHPTNVTLHNHSSEKCPCVAAMKTSNRIVGILQPKLILRAGSLGCDPDTWGCGTGNELNEIICTSWT